MTLVLFVHVLCSVRKEGRKEVVLGGVEREMGICFLFLLCCLMLIQVLYFFFFSSAPLMENLTFAGVFGSCF